MRFNAASLTFINRRMGSETLFPTTCALYLWWCILNGKYFLAYIPTSLTSCESIGYVQIYLSLAVPNTSMAAYPPFYLVNCCAAPFSHVFARLQLFDMGCHGVDPSYMRLKRGDWTLVVPVLFGTRCVDPSSLDDMQGLRGCRDGMYTSSHVKGFR